ncbi:MAG: peptidase T [Eubacteriales bacterium]|nr:peptidase T [Eubacteriales bacterium]
MTVEERLIEYAKMSTASSETSAAVPSTPCQLELSKRLCRELKEMGVEATCTEQGYVYARIPANTDEPIPAVGFIAHVDTSPAVSGENVRPRLIERYDGRDIPLGGGVTISVSEFPALTDYKGKTLIVTDGTTLLGADDKAGVAEIMDMVGRVVADPALKHGPIGVAFTPDEEIGCGADHFDVEKFACDFAYTVDGGPLGELEYENFNAAGATLTVNGKNIHPGTARGKMKNALLIAMEFQALLPPYETPACTDGYEGFYHLDSMSGEVESATLRYIIRDHDREKFEARKKLFASAASYLNDKYGAGTVVADIRDSYYNMRALIEDGNLYVVELMKNAMRDEGVEPIVRPIRGGTDGARLTYMGLPCPNICTGGNNFHSRQEYVCVESMRKIVDILISAVKRTAELRK